MKKKLICIFGVIGALAFSGLVTDAKAQTADGTILQEVKISSNDGFNELRNLVIQNFDFNNPNLSEGDIDSVVKFNVNADGKISNVNVKGECKYVSEELEDVMKRLLFKFKTDNKSILTSTYSFPVRVLIASK